MLIKIARIGLLLVVLTVFLVGYPVVTEPLLRATHAASAGADGLFDARIDLPDGRILVVAEADREPRSIGSYSVRLYSGRNPSFPYDDFVAGVIEKRDGFIVSARLADVDGDAQPELVVTMQSAGSGSYLAADAYSFTDESITRVAHVEGLAPQADVVAALLAD